MPVASKHLGFMAGQFWLASCGKDTTVSSLGSGIREHWNCVWKRTPTPPKSTASSIKWEYEGLCHNVLRTLNEIICVEYLARSLCVESAVVLLSVSACPGLLFSGLCLPGVSRCLTCILLCPGAGGGHFLPV